MGGEGNAGNGTELSDLAGVLVTLAANGAIPSQFRHPEHTLHPDARHDPLAEQFLARAFKVVHQIASALADFEGLWQLIPAFA